jgi:alpha-amylase
VAQGYQTWIKELVSNYSIDGLRLDTVFEVNKGFWSGFRSAAGIYMIGEIDLDDPSWVCSYQTQLPGVLNYGTYFPLVSAFSSTSGSMPDLASTVDAVKSECKDTSLIGTFSENHDQPRFAFLTPDMALASNVVTFTMLADGIPIIYEGQEQHYAAVGSTNGNDPYNREAIWLSGYNTSVPLYKLITKLNAARKQAIKDDSSYLTYQNWPIYNDTTTIAMRKGNMVTVLSNKGANGASYSQSIPAGYTAGTKVTELLSCKTLTADSSGNIEVPMAKGAPRVYYPTSALDGSGICGASSKRWAHEHALHPHKHKFEMKHK